MSELFTLLINWIEANPLWAGLAVFFVAFAESVAVFGLLVPGVLAMFGFGALIATGRLEFWPVFWWAVCGAVAGDGLSFWLGHRYRDRLRSLWPFNRHPRSLERGIEFFHRFGGKSVAAGRFFGPVRAIIPLVAGMMGMSPWRFLVANLLSALVWAPAYLLPGIAFGASLELASEVAFRLVFLLLLVLLVAWLLFVIVRVLFRLIQPHATQLVQWAFDWGVLHRGFRSISLALADPQHPEARGLAALATLLLVTTLLFVLITGVVLGGSLTAGMDQLVYATLQSLRTPWGDHLMTALSAPADIGPFLLFTLGMALVLRWRGDSRVSWYLLAAALFGLLAPLLLKYGLRVPRPPAAGESLGPWSFPSAHMLRAVTLYGFFSILLARSLQREWRWLPYSLASLLIGGVALSRLYLGAHWLTDILGSLMLGMAWIAFLGIAYHRHVEQASQKGLMIGAALGLALLASALSQTSHETRYLSYRTIETPVSYALEGWQTRISSELPRQRGDLQGQGDHPLNLILAGDPHCLLQKLGTADWRAAEMLGWHNALSLLSGRSDLSRQPVLPQVHGDVHEAAIFVQEQSDGSRRLLRFWPTSIELDPGQIPVYVGNISVQRSEPLLHLLSIARTDDDFAQPFSLLLKEIDPDKTGVIQLQPDRLLIDLTAQGFCTTSNDQASL